MKKAIAWILALLLVVLAAGCANASGSRSTEGSGAETRDPDDSSEPTVAVPEELAEYLTQNGDYWFLTLPVSGQRVSIARNDRRLIDKIDLGLLREAEETLLAKVPSNEQGHSFSVAAGTLVLGGGGERSMGPLRRSDRTDQSAAGRRGRCDDGVRDRPRSHLSGRRSDLKINKTNGRDGISVAPFLLPFFRASVLRGVEEGGERDVEHLRQSEQFNVRDRPTAILDPRHRAAANVDPEQFEPVG